jgi:hypothetical protein
MAQLLRKTCIGYIFTLSRTRAVFVFAVVYRGVVFLACTVFFEWNFFRDQFAVLIRIPREESVQFHSLIIPFFGLF